MTRGMAGVLPRTPKLEDESYLDYLEGVRNFAIRELFPLLGSQLENSAERAGLERGGAGASSADIEALAARTPLAGAWKRLMRSQQQLTWRKIRDSLHENAAAYERELAEAERKHPGRLHYDPAFVVPDYATLDIHLQPGGYVGDALAGYVFHHGTKVFYQGENDQDELHGQVVSMVRPPADGRARRILDLGCSIGQCTTALEQRFPQAEVWGLDVALPLLRYAHKRVVDLDVDVCFVQGLAEDTKLPGASFDAVLAYILFHEVPQRLFVPIIEEVRRLLRPGGTFTIVDAPNGRDFPAPNRLWMDFDARFNCEPYSPAFVASDLRAMLESHGFEVTHAGPTPTFLTCTVGKKL
jgi:ubiquinone/menaquinone biosynthesis C-methylase UbiE